MKKTPAWRFGRSAGFIAGVVAALGVIECALRPFSNATAPPLPRIAADSFSSPRITVRQIEEGVATSHYSIGGARLTGIDPIDDAPTAVVLGDSYVVALEVGDGETLGAWVEKLSRQSARPINVRQYGWRGATPVQYLTVSHEVLARWAPNRVIIVLSDDDLDLHPLTVGEPHLRIVGGVAHLVGAPVSEPAAQSRPGRSVLLGLVRRRFDLAILHAPPAIRYRRAVRAARAATTQVATAASVAQQSHEPITPDELTAVPQAVVDKLADAYGSSLMIVYAAKVFATGGESPDPLEVALLSSCRVRQVKCLSLRAPMLAMRNRGRAVRGFSTTSLDDGHLNAAGHEVAGRAIWTILDGGVRSRRPH